MYTTILRFFACFGFLSLLFGCSSAPQEVQKDNYASSSPGTMLEIPAGVDSFLTPKKLADIESYELKQISASTKTFIGIGIKDINLLIKFSPRENDVVIQFSNQSNKVSLYLSERTRVLLISAISKYMSDFENRVLERKRGTDKVYGISETTVEWYIFSSFTQTSRALPKMKIGYEFVDQAPYFTLTFPESDNVYYSDAGPNRIKKSTYIQIFFTRSQLAEFGEMLIQEYLESTLEEQNISRASSDPDTY